MPRADIRASYNSALDAQQRLLVMRGQLEKLQSDETSLKKYISLLGRIDLVLAETQEPSAGGRSKRNGSAMLEMLINAQEAERQRLSRQMHDGPAQALSNFIVQAEIAARLFDLDPNKAKEELSLLKNAAMGTFQKVRTFISELRPMSLDDLGLVPTLRRYIDIYKEATGFEVNLNVKGTEQRLQSYLEVMVFRALQELMGNVARHNGDHAAKVLVNVQVTIDESLVRVTVSDNGRGFDPDEVQESGGLGLKLIRERAEMLGGYLNIDSAPGQGSRITFQIPIDASALAGEG
jgi:two-component system sensor histidine kinase DegS